MYKPSRLSLDNSQVSLLKLAAFGQREVWKKTSEACNEDDDI